MCVVKRMAVVVLSAALLSGSLAAGVQKEVEILPGGSAECRVKVSDSGNYSISNRLGNIQVYPVAGSELVLSVDGLEYTGDRSAYLRVWEPESGNFIVGVHYPRLQVVPPAGGVDEIAATGSPADGIVKRGNVLIIGGMMVLRGDVLQVRVKGALTVNGYVGSTNLKVGIPGTVANLKATTMSGDVVISDLPPSDTNRAVIVETDAGVVTVSNTLAPGGIVINARSSTISPHTCGNALTGLNAKALKERFEFDSAIWPALE